MREHEDDQGREEAIRDEGSAQRGQDGAGGTSVSDILARMRGEDEDPRPRRQWDDEPAGLDEDAETASWYDSSADEPYRRAASSSSAARSTDSRSAHDSRSADDSQLAGGHRSTGRDELPGEATEERAGAVATATRGSGASAAADREVNDPGWRKLLRGLGQTLITLGVVVLLFIVYEAFVTDIFTAQKQDQLNDELHEDWQDDPTVPTQELNFADVQVGDAFAVMRIPAFGADYAQVVVQGTTTEALEKGPGHYSGTAGPGEVGNFSIAGHRVGKGSPFLNLDKLKPGDAIVFETESHWYVYRVIGNKDTGDWVDPAYGDIQGQFITTPSHYEVIAPVPGDESATPTQKLATLTTCHPKFSAAERMIIHSYLDGEPLSKADYPNPEDVPALTEG